MYISFTVKDVQAVKDAWEVLKDGGEILWNWSLPFAELHGSLQDKFGSIECL